MNRRFDSGSLTTGLFLIAIGVLFLLDRFGIADVHYLFRTWWPMVIVAFGATRLFGRHFWGGLWLIAVGGWLQVARLRLWDLTFSSSWPLLLIVLGAGMIARTFIDSMRRQEPAPPEDRHGA